MENAPTSRAVETGSDLGVPWLIPAVAGLCGAVAMIAALGPAAVHPTNHDWLMRGDFGLHFLGWHLYRHGPWTLPLGATPLLIWPVGSSVGLTDSIPIAAFLFKLIDPLLPPIFQFIGLWLAASFALQGVFGALLMRLATPRPSLQFLGAMLFVLSPPLIFRFGHAALTAHWLLLAALWLSLNAGADHPSRRRAAGWAVLTGLSAAIQPYLMLMVVVLMLAAHVRQVLTAPRQALRIGLHAATALTAAWVALWQSGSLMVDSDAGLSIGGFDVFSANLLTFVMPTEASTLLSPGPIPYASAFQYEGYAYLGAGMLLLGLVVLVAALASRRSAASTSRPWRHVPLLLALLFLTAMAVGPTITAGSRTLFSYDLHWWGPLLAFRTHARMIWPLYYAVVVAILFAAMRFKYRTALGLLLLGVLLQAVDLAGMAAYVGTVRHQGFLDPLGSRFWQVAPPRYERLVLIPTNLCERDAFGDLAAFSLLAGRHGLAINAGITARYDVRRTAAYCGELDQEVRQGLQTAGSLYIVRRDLLPRVASPAAANGPMCTVVDGFGVCFSPDSYRHWRQAFEIPRAKLPSTEEFVGFYEALDDTYRTMLGRTPQAAPETTERRVDVIVRYLANRIEGCTHDEAASWALGHPAGSEEPVRCARVSTRPEFPAADDTHAFTVHLYETLGAQRGTPTAPTHVDPEGEAVWLQAYAAQRLQGRTARQARDAVLEAIRMAAR